jgi:NADPH:quinone reductase-like Zn-dependent oxidoreductase
MMKAIRYHRYGSPEVLRLEDIDVPALGDEDVLIRVRAASVNPLDLHFIRGLPYIVRRGNGLLRPDDGGVGVDLAGYVEKVGKDVTRFSPGDEVFGCVAVLGSLAEYVSMHQDQPLLAKPANQSFEQAASVPVAAVTALQGLRDHGRLQPGQKVLVNGAAGGVGTFTVQIARALGAEVTGVCSTRNVELVESIGASRVIDYTRQDFTRSGQRYDLLIDIAGSKPFAAYRRVLTPQAMVVGIGGGPSKGRVLGPMTRVIKALLLSRFTGQQVTFFMAKPSSDDLAVLRDLLVAGKVTPVIDRCYPLSEAAEAIRYLEAGHARGKVVVTM